MSVHNRRTPRLQTMAIAVTALFIAVGSLVTQQTPATHAADNSTLVVARDIADGKTMDPGHFYEFTSNAMATNCYDTLVTYHGSNTSRPEPDLATSWTVSPDAKVFTFHLRHDVRFSTGNPMTADDVVFSYRRLNYLQDNPSFLISGATDIRALDTYTVRITLGAPDVSFLSALATNNFAVIDSRVVKAHGGDDSPQAATKDTARSFLDTRSVGTGAFQMTQWARRSQIVMTRNPYYWGPRPRVATLIFQNQQDAATQSLLVQKGSVDVAENISIQQAQPLRSNASVQVVAGNTLDLIYIGMTTSITVSRPLSNKLVRRAIRYAIDYDGILKGLLQGIGTRPNSMIPVGMLGNSTTTNNSLLERTDIARAKSLLKQAGYANGFTAKLSYDVNTTFDGVNYDPLAAKLQNDLARIGVTLTLDPQQDSVLLPAYRGQKLQMILYNWGVDFPDPNDYAAPFSPGGGPARRMFYTLNKALTTVVTQADTTNDTARRAALYLRVQQTWLDESPWIGLVQPQNIVVLARGIKGYVYSPILPANFRTASK